ncbi:MAG: methyl-accepting chemotaxis protein [Corticimicrobacter sp.]|uniref:methyl-accepting chemotaxis protein n=1 Tax=Corticimicrobacter sp. TaxID=2678536 RepID=UPI0032DAF445
MRVFANMKLGRLLAVGFAGVIAVGVLVAAFAALRLDAANDLQGLTQARLNDLNMLQEVKNNANLRARLLRDGAVDAALRGRADDVRSLEQATARNTEILTTFRRLVNGAASLPGIDQREVAEASGLLGRIEQTRPAYLDVSDKAWQRIMAGDAEGARGLIAGPLRTVQVAYFDAVDAMIAYQSRVTLGTSAQSERDLHQALVILLVLTIVSVLLGCVVAWTITRRIKTQLGGEPVYAARIAQDIAQGNLAIEVEVHAGDTTSVLAAMRAMRNSLAQVVGEVRQSSESIATGSSEIASGNADLSQRTEEQASSLEQTAAAMEQMNSTVRQNADTVDTVAQLANSASTTAVRGGEVVGDVVRTMEAITASSRKIADITGVIDSIAFQTNILALNAAVEAARAGEQGKGFAVVAGEVRTLAQRSAQAAKEIKDLIGESVSKVEDGAQQVGEAGSTMSEIVDQVKRVADLIAEIGAATHEQTQGISQVGDAVNQLDQVTQQNAALVEQSAAAAASLNEQAARLVELVSVFRLGVTGTSDAVQVRPAARIQSSGRTAAPVRRPVARTAPAKARPAAALAHDKTSTPRAAADKADDWDTF